MDLKTARDLLLELPRATTSARSPAFRWPALDEFNWALDWFDAIARGNDAAGAVDRRARTAARTGSVVRRAVGALEPGRQLAARARRRARRPDPADARQPGRAVGDDARGDEARRGDHPGDDAARPADLADRVERGDARHVVAAQRRRRQVRRRAGRLHADRRRRRRRPAGTRTPTPTARRRRSRPTAPTHGRPIRCCSTSPRARRRSRSSSSTRTRRYPVGHLSTMYWIGLQPGDVHLNISLAGLGQARLEQLLRALERRGDRLRLQLRRASTPTACSTRIGALGVTTLCAPPTVWRMLIQEDLARVDGAAARGGRRRRAAQPGGHRAGAARPGASPSATATARPRRRRRSATRRASRSSPARWAGRCPATRRAARSADGRARPTRARSASTARPPAARPDGRLPRRSPSARPRRCAAATTTPATSPRATPTATSPTSAAPTTSSRRPTTASRPFELESVLIEHDGGRRGRRRARRPTRCGWRCRRRTSCWRRGCEPNARDGARRSSRYAREHLAPYKRIRRLEFAELPKTISGKIRRVELRASEDVKHAPTATGGARRVQRPGLPGAARLARAEADEPAQRFVAVDGELRVGRRRGGQARRERDARRVGHGRTLAITVAVPSAKSAAARPISSSPGCTSDRPDSHAESTICPRRAGATRGRRPSAGRPRG